MADAPPTDATDPSGSTAATEAAEAAAASTEAAEWVLLSESDDDDGDGGDVHGHGTGAVFAALGANLAIAVAKFAGFIVTGSSSMLAESVHSTADSGNQFLLLLGRRRARKEADQLHPFGYGRERYFWGFVVALVLFSLGSMFAIYEGVHKIQHPEHIESPEWAIGILAFAILAEGFSFRTAIKASSQLKGEATYWQFIRRAKSPELPVVLLEDLGALIGLTLAMGGLITAVITDDGIWDGYGTLSIGILLFIIAAILVVEMKSLLIGESASPKALEAIHAAVEIEPEVIRLIHLRAIHLGPEELLVGVKVEFLHELALPEMAAAINRVERNIRNAIPAARVIYVEPDVHDDHRRHAVYVAEHGGHIDVDDPKYAQITGVAPDPDDDIWS
jgi:cation diffusion facilitator family transporter